MTADVSPARRWLDELRQAREKATLPWERCGCFESHGRLNPDCHQMGLCAMRQHDREREDNTRRLAAAVEAVLDLADDFADAAVRWWAMSAVAVPEAQDVANATAQGMHDAAGSIRAAVGEALGGAS